MEKRETKEIFSDRFRKLRGSFRVSLRNVGRCDQAPAVKPKKVGRPLSERRSAVQGSPQHAPLMPRSNAVSEEVWAKAIHAVTVQKMSLRQAAHVYGVHHMSLHRRVRGLNGSLSGSPLPPSSPASSTASGSQHQPPQPQQMPPASPSDSAAPASSTSPVSFEMSSFLSEDDEAEVFCVLREQFLHEKRITSEDVRFVVRAIASRGGKRPIPPDFPSSRWINEFKRARGFSGFQPARPNPDEQQQDGDEDQDRQQSREDGQWEQQSDRGSEEMDGASSSRRGLSGANPTQFERDSRAGMDRYATRGSTSSSMSGASSTSSRVDATEQGEKRSYKLSHTVPAEVWEKAIAAVEQQGMSLRAAAKMYDVHFAALHRRVKKRAQCEQPSSMDGYFHPDDESGIIRVVVARAELGVLMTFDELMDLVQRAALRNLPDISVDAARKLMARFHSRNEHAIRHIVVDWPMPQGGAPRFVESMHAEHDRRAPSEYSASYQHYPRSPQSPQSATVTPLPPRPRSSSPPEQSEQQPKSPSHRLSQPQQQQQQQLEVL